MSLFIRLCLLISLPVLASSQNLICGSNLDLLDGTELQAIQARHQKVRHSELRSNQLDSVAVTIHQVHSSEGQANIIYEEMARMIALANREFESMGLHFYLCGSPRYLDGQSNYTFHEAEGLNFGQHAANTLNIFLVDGVMAPNGNRLCGFSKFPFQSDPEERYIILAKDCALSGVTLIHELGHFYGLLHTHENRFGYELVNGNNCHSAGDLICDTPADPNLIFPNSVSNCGYIGNRVDINGDRYAPSVQNFMSNAPFSCQQVFTREQKQFMLAIAREENQYLGNHSCDIQGDLSIKGQLELNSLKKSRQIPARFQLQSLDLPALEGVRLRIDLYTTPSRRQGITLYEAFFDFKALASMKTIPLNLAIPQTLTTGTYYLVAELDANYKVIETTESNNRFIREIKIDNSHFPDMVLFPNPAQETVHFFLRNPPSSGAYTISLFNASGQKIFQVQGSQAGREVLQAFDVSQLPGGIYLANIEFEDTAVRRSIRFFKR